MSAAVKVVGFKAVQSSSNGLTGFCDLAFECIVVHGVAIRRNDKGELWPGLPSKPPKENSQDKRWQPIVSFRKDSKDELQREIIRQVEALHRGGS